MKIWKPLTKFRYTDERDEYKYHTDFALEEGESILVLIGRDGGTGKKVLLNENVPKGMLKKYHFELAVESFAEKHEEIYNGVPISEIKVGGTD